MSLNKVMLIGNLGKDPEIRQAGSANVCEFSIACTEKWKSQQGEAKEKTEWVNITCWRDLADIVKKYCFKGDKVFIEGKLETQSWDDRESGQKRYKTHVVADKVQFLTDKRNQGAPPAQRSGGGGAQGASSSGGRASQSPAEDDLPF